MFKFCSFESCRSHPSIDHDSRIQSMVQTYRQKIFYSVFGPYRGSAMDQRKGVKIAYTVYDIQYMIYFNFLRKLAFFILLIESLMKDSEKAT